MADFTVIPANVLQSVNARVVQQIAGVAITRGQSLYLDPATNTVKLFKANGANPINVFYGIALEDVGSGQTLLVCLNDSAFTPGFALAAGAVVIGSGATAGNLAPVADNTSGWFNTIVGIGIGSNQMKLFQFAAGVAT